MNTLLFATLVFFVQIGISCGGGVGQIQFVRCSLRKEQHVCDFNTDSCDPYLVICIDSDPSSESYNEEYTNCRYGYGVTETSINVNEFDIDSNITGMRNPFKFKFKNGVYIKIKGYDHDEWMLDDVIGSINDSYTYIRGNNSISFPRREIMEDDNIRVEMVLNFYCDEFYYGDCSKYCKVVPDRYTCDSNGDKICLPDWTGRECNITKTGNDVTILPTTTGKTRDNITSTDAITTTPKTLNNNENRVIFDNKLPINQSAPSKNETASTIISTATTSLVTTSGPTAEKGFDWMLFIGVPGGLAVLVLTVGICVFVKRSRRRRRTFPKETSQLHMKSFTALSTNEGPLV